MKFLPTALKTISFLAYRGLICTFILQLFLGAISIHIIMKGTPKCMFHSSISVWMCVIDLVSAVLTMNIRNLTIFLQRYYSMFWISNLTKQFVDPYVLFLFLFYYYYFLKFLLLLKFCLVAKKKVGKKRRNQNLRFMFYSILFFRNLEWRKDKPSLDWA